MNLQNERNYWQAAALSFRWQIKTREVSISDSTVTEIPLGFQPLGISARGDRVLIADYFAPAVCMNRVTVQDSVLKFEVAWIHGARNGITKCRGGFPDMAYPYGANRCVTAFFAPCGKSVCIGRGDREFFVLRPEEEGQWRITARISLPQHSGYPWVHSATLRSNVLWTVESDASMNNWRSALYLWDNMDDWVIQPPLMLEEGSASISRFHYGITHMADEAVLVASSHAIRGECAGNPGIYVGGKLVVPDIIGSGICLLPNGGALVSQYGQEEDGAHKGNHGKLTYVPPAFLRR